MKCEYFRELISAGLDGELEKDEKLALAEHLRGCGECKEFAAELKEIELLSAEREPLTMPGDLAKKILTRTIRQKTKRRPVLEIFRGYYRIPRSLIWAGVVVLMLLVVDKLTAPSVTAPKATILIQPTENVLTVQKVIISEKDIVASSSIKKSKDPI
jgi:predicted anti-sigma-YlaC factor YlaD